jgi:hypothetical protein
MNWLKDMPQRGNEMDAYLGFEEECENCHKFIPMAIYISTNGAECPYCSYSYIETAKIKTKTKKRKITLKPMNKIELLESRPRLSDLVRGSTSENIVVGGDLDGWISGLILTNKTNAIIRGVYNNRELALHRDYQGKDCWFIDFDIAMRHILSLGHHITSPTPGAASHLYHPQSVQINDLCGVAVKGSKDEKNFFSFKYPFSTCWPFLVWLLGLDPMELTPKGRFLLMYADGAAINCFNYAQSAEQWTKTFGDYVVLPMESFGGFTLSVKLPMWYRETMRGSHLSRSPGTQGKGSEKAKIISVENGCLSLPSKNGKNGLKKCQEMISFIKGLGKEIGLPYKPERWQCFSELKLYQFEAHTLPKEKGVRFEDNFAELSKRDDLISLTFLSSTGKIDYTIGDPSVIAAAFGKPNNPEPAEILGVRRLGNYAMAG